VVLTCMCSTSPSQTICVQLAKGPCYGVDCPQHVPAAADSCMLVLWQAPMFTRSPYAAAGATTTTSRPVVLLAAISSHLEVPCTVPEAHSY
jgi:hypothetical protein